MRVYIRRWTAVGMYERVATLEIDSYNAVSFYSTEEAKAAAAKPEGVVGRVQHVFMHASEPGALVVYMEPTKGGGR